MSSSLVTDWKRSIATRFANRLKSHLQWNWRKTTERCRNVLAKERNAPVFSLGKTLLFYNLFYFRWQREALFALSPQPFVQLIFIRTESLSYFPNVNKNNYWWIRKIARKITYFGKMFPSKSKTAKALRKAILILFMTTNKSSINSNSILKLNALNTKNYSNISDGFNRIHQRFIE